MDMVEGSTRLKNLGEQDREKNRGLLRSGRVCILTGGYTFKTPGTFELLVPGPRNSEPRRELMWANLFRYDPQRFTLETSSEEGDLLVLNKFHDLVKKIPPQNVRVVDDTLSEIGIVRKSGYVLGRFSYPLGKEKVPTNEFEKILVRAEEGIRPPAYKEIPYVKVDSDPDLVGHRVHVLFFQSTEGKNIWERDAVVIGLARKLIKRQILRPLSETRWIKYI